LRIEIDHETSLRAFQEIWRLALRYQLTAYDAAYLELAVRRQLSLITSDGRLLAAAADLKLA